MFRHLRLIAFFTALLVGSALSKPPVSPRQVSQPVAPGRGVSWGLIFGSLVTVALLVGGSGAVVGATVDLTDEKFLPVLGTSVLVLGAVIQMLGSADDLTRRQKDWFGLIGWGTVLSGAIVSLLAAITA
jgi:predicted phage tail protein